MRRDIKVLPEKIAIEWHWLDVKSRVDGLTKEQCMEVLQRLEDNHDGENGINWDVIDATIYAMYGDKR